MVGLPAPRPGQPAEPPPAEPAGAHNVVAIRLRPGETLTVNPSPEPEPDSGKREDFDFLGHTFYMASKELSAKLPFIGLTATEYDVWHTMLGAQLKGGIVPITVIKLGERLGIGRKEAARPWPASSTWASCGWSGEASTGSTRASPSGDPAPSSSAPWR